MTVQARENTVHADYDMLLPCDCIFVNVHYMKMLGKMILLDQTAEGDVHNYAMHWRRELLKVREATLLN